MYLLKNTNLGIISAVGWTPVSLVGVIISTHCYTKLQRYYDRKEKNIAEKERLTYKSEIKYCHVYE